MGEATNLEETRLLGHVEHISGMARKGKKQLVKHGTRARASARSVAMKELTNALYARAAPTGASSRTCSGMAGSLTTPVAVFTIATFVKLLLVPA